MAHDSRDAAMRYRLEKEARERGEEPEPEAEASARTWTREERAAIVEASIEQAIRRGEFDNLPGAGKPIPGLGATHDPDWWIRRKIERERLTGLGPPALTLRTEYAELGSRLDALPREADVREYVADFNRRVIEARRQLLGGPPVVTPTVDVDEAVADWAERRHAAQRSASEQQARETVPHRRRRLRRST